MPSKKITIAKLVKVLKKIIEEFEHFDDDRELSFHVVIDMISKWILAECDNGDQRFWLMWHYVANHNDRVIEISGTNWKTALRDTFKGYGDEFYEKAKVFIFDRAPVVCGGLKSLVVDDRTDEPR